MNAFEYWEAQAREKGAGGNLKHNCIKQCEILRRLLAHQPFKKRVVEVGCGQAITAAAVNLTCLGHTDYLGLEIAPSYVDLVRKRWKMEALLLGEGDHLPVMASPIDQAWLFDVLEHIDPATRTGYARWLSRNLKPDGVVLINTPIGEDGHGDEFSWRFEEAELAQFCADGGFLLAKWEVYVLAFAQPLMFAWAELVKRS
jgi:SAM-dependent methyltransferase